jgi:protocatechuate 3,4-dioxygenase beta subunit
MIPSIPRFSLALLLITVALFTDAQQTRDPQQAKEIKSASVSGTVVDSADRVPIRGVDIFLQGTPGEGKAVSEIERHSTRSAGDGAFSFEDLPAGRYSIHFRKPGYAGMRTNTSKRPSREIAVTLAADQKLTDLKLELVASAVIVGRVVDEEGSPLEGLQVEPRQWRFENGKRRLSQGGPRFMGTTNDRGEYRLYGLLPGRYYLQVSPMWWSGESAGGRLVKTFYTNSRNVDNATPVVLGPGDEVRADIILAHVPGVRVRGTLTGALSGLEKGEFIIELKGEDNSRGTGMLVKPDGSFEQKSVTPGTYDLVVSTYEFGQNTGPKEVTRTRIEVPPGGLDNVKIPISSAVTGKGEIQGVLSAAEKDFRPGGFFVHLELSDPPMDDEYIFIGGGGHASAKADGTFKMGAPAPGSYYLRAFERGSGTSRGNWIIDSIEFNGRDFTNKPLTLPSNATGTLRITMSSKSATLEGTVTDNKGKPEPQSQIMLMPSDDNKRPDLYHTAQSDQNGRFKIRGIVPGSYNVIALSDLDSDAAADPNFVKTIGSRGTSVRLEAGTPQTIALKVTTDFSQQ